MLRVAEDFKIGALKHQNAGNEVPDTQNIKGPSDPCLICVPGHWETAKVAPCPS